MIAIQRGKGISKARRGHQAHFESGLSLGRCLRKRRGINSFSWNLANAPATLHEFLIKTHRISVHVIEGKSYSMLLTHLHFSHQNIDF